MKGGIARSASGLARSGRAAGAGQRAGAGLDCRPRSATASTKRRLPHAGGRLDAAARWGTPDDVAGAAVFLASPAAAFVTGQTIMVGGGVVMCVSETEHGDERDRPYDEAQIAERLKALPGWYFEDELDPPRLQDRRLADDADAGQRDRLLCRGRRPSSGSVGDVGPRSR